MKDLKIFLEYRTASEIKIKCEQTGKEIDPNYTIYDEDSLNNIIQSYKQNKEQFDKLSIYFAEQKGNIWIAHTRHKYKMDIGRVSDKFIYSNKKSYSYSDIINLLNNDNIMLLFIF